jgi:hypothetical protein
VQQAANFSLGLLIHEKHDAREIDAIQESSQLEDTALVGGRRPPLPPWFIFRFWDQ